MKKVRNFSAPGEDKRKRGEKARACAPLPPKASGPIKAAAAETGIEAQAARRLRSAAANLSYWTSLGGVYAP